MLTTVLVYIAFFCICVSLPVRHLLANTYSSVDVMTSSCSWLMSVGEVVSEPFLYRITHDVH